MVGRVIHEVTMLEHCCYRKGFRVGSAQPLSTYGTYLPTHLSDVLAYPCLPINTEQPSFFVSQRL